MTQPIQSTNASYDDAGARVSCMESGAEIGSEGTGGAAPVSGSGGSEGAGNIEKNSEPEASLRCLPEAVVAAKECGSALLVKSFSSALVCGMKLEALRECLASK
jgi:hypothetical protein